MEHVMDKELYWCACVALTASIRAFVSINAESAKKTKKQTGFHKTAWSRRCEMTKITELACFYVRKKS